ncbi:MAG: hypothetical protein Q8L54_07995 [Devosia sp.]|nr:hypothetical protein [Devosia sp.]
MAYGLPTTQGFVAQLQAALYPFFLDGVAMDADLNQSDLRHPDAEGVEKIVAAMPPYVQQLLRRTD